MIGLHTKDFKGICIDDVESMRKKLDEYDKASADKEE